MEMLIIDGKRYRPEDAKRLGLLAPDPEPAKPKVQTRRKTAAKNKARQVEGQDGG